MDLSTETSEVRSIQDESLCSICSRFTLAKLRRGFILPSLKELIAPSRACRLCRFISLGWPRTLNTLINNRSGRLPSLKLCLQSGEVDEFYNQRRHQKSPTSRMVQMWDVVLLTDDNLRGLRFNDIEWSILGRLSASTGDDFLAKHSHKDTNCRPVLAADSTVNFERVKGWLKTCISSHMQCRRTIAGTEVNDAFSQSPMPNRVISVGLQDTDAPRLFVSRGKIGRYAALSYCWGDDAKKPLVTTLSNIGDMQKAIPQDLLPKTIKDAIQATRMLGIEYLWVDSICIIQDDPGDFEKESPSMGKIYQQAILTIAATSARKSSEGLFKPRSVDIETSAGEPHCVRLPSEESGELVDDLILYVKGFPDHHVLRKFDSELSESEWRKRGWVVQERLLSRRILHYGSEQLFWECQKGVFAESTVGPLPESSLVHSKRSMFNRILRETTLAARTTASSNQLQTFRAMAYLSLDKILDSFGIARWSVEEARHRFWERVVQTYNVCDLTYEKDKLPAISGLAQEIGAFTRQTYFQGVWLEDIARGLYWYGSDRKQQLLRLEAADAPTWSWASWKGPLRMATYLAEYDTGRTRVTVHTLENVQAGTSRSGVALELHAHFWKAQTKVSLSPNDLTVRDQQWIVLDWWTPPSFIEDLYSGFPDWNCCELRGDPSDPRSCNIHGLVAFDCSGLECYSGKELTCVVLNTVRIKNVRSGESGYGYYQLIVGESNKVPGTYERLGVGISIAAETDHIAHGWLGRKAPASTISLV